MSEIEEQMKKVVDAVNIANAETPEEPQRIKRRASARQKQNALKSKPGNGVTKGHPRGYRAVKLPLRHPYTGMWFKVVGEPSKPLEEDSWLKCQIDAGLITKV